MAERPGFGSPARPLAVVVGGIGKLPIAGMSLFFLHHVVGLQELGYDVHYVERQNRPDDCYDPETGEMTSDCSYALAYLRRTLPRFSIGERRFSFIDLQGECHGSGWPALEQALDRADFALTVGNPTWFDELERCPRRAFIDGDPLFTQVAVASGVGTRAEAPGHYPVLFSYGTRIGSPDCSIPTAGRTWLPARPVVATSIWRPEPRPTGAPVAALLHWAAGSEIEYGGRVYGHKDREFAALIGLPGRVPQSRFVLAAGGGNVPRSRFAAAGWELTSALAPSLTLDAFMAFVTASLLDFGVAKHAYVASRSGWFSDRSTCFLAAGRPVVHQDTGFTDWLPVGEGVLAFSTEEGAAAAIEEIEQDYDRHCRAARRLAEEHFEARLVLDSMLTAAGFR